MDDPVAAPAGSHRTWARGCAWGLLGIALAIFCGRVFFRGGERAVDFAVCSSAAHVWASGGNPYDSSQVQRDWERRGGGGGGGPVDITSYPVLVFPSLLPLMAPFAALPPAIGMWLWLGINLLLLLVSAAALADLAAFSPLGSRAVVMLAGMLLLGPVQSMIESGQPAGPAVAMIILAAWAAARGRGLAGGLLLTLSAGFKAQLGAPFILYMLIRRRWTMAAVGIAGWAVLLAIAVVPLCVREGRALATWRQNITRSAAPGEVADFSTAHWAHDHLVNLQVIAYGVYPGRTAAHFAAGSIALVLAGLVALRLWRDDGQVLETVHSRGRDGPFELLAIGAWGAVMLLPVYHRYYDAAILSAALAWAISAWRTPMRAWAAVILVLLLGMLPPVGWQTTLLRRHRLPQWWSDTWPWRAVVDASQAWVTLLIAVLLAMVIWRWRSTPARRS